MMPRTILVHVDDTDAWRTRLDIARSLLGDAPESGFVLGIYGVVDHTERHPYSRQVSSDFLAKVDAAEAPFREACAQRGMACGWHGIRGADANVIGVQIAANLQTADLGILSQPREGDAGHTVPNDVIEQVAVSAGRPMLVLPYITKSFAMPERAVIALNEDAASARALSDALPYLTGCSMVTLLAVSRDPVAQQWRWEAHKAMLARHGIPAQIEHEAPTDIPVSELILSRCADLAADMLAMGAHGAYDTPRLRRGGVTKSILPGLTLPLLLSR
ncbi:universal stress protein [Roseospira marina]|uniref:Universal stress protein n=1 Tax=Roseospira marina TaxID=140057 RepID=A0A5M6I9S5_9PROT|nr:universal stress protein [Roseospira marina]KAA5604912.1 universal stress protein [Roseospira marina]MBB4315252.1 nucleotide-binding universal stress UspA family protein [Roseospira marina]MBB5088252.1 nucleotide-binding universal stress UspA family protein [Roseospira marina]